MGTERIGVPVSAPQIEIDVVYLHKGKEPGAFMYLQGMRSGSLRLAYPEPEKSGIALTYHRNTGNYAKALAEQVIGQVDAILSPPSRMSWQAEPYRKAIADLHRSAIDLTDRVEKNGVTRAGEGTTIATVMSELSYSPTGGEEKFKRIVVVDDTLNTGTTAAAMALLLQQHGLPKSCEIVLACPLWLKTFKG